MPKIIDITGQTFGRLTAISKQSDKSGRSSYLCKCSCGCEKVVSASNLRTGKTYSCGCARIERAKAIAESRKNEDALRNTPLYQRWATMIQRCHNKNNPSFKNYGDRGIFVCENWRNSYHAFLDDMGFPPTPKHTIERIDNNQGYSKCNCKWALRSEQLKNQQRSIIINVNGESIHAKEVSSKYGISYQSITKHFRLGGIEAANAYVASKIP